MNKLTNHINKNSQLSIDQLIEKYILNSQQSKYIMNNIEPRLYNEKYKKRIYWDNRLFFFGDRHISDKNDPQYVEIREFANIFLTHNIWKKNIVMVEWCKNAPTDFILSRKEWAASKTLVEFAYINNIERFSPEPDFKDEIDYIKTKWLNINQIMYFYISRAISQYYRWQSWYDTIEEYLETLNFNDEFAIINWCKYSLKLFEKMHEDIFNNKLDLTNVEHFRSNSSPNKNTLWSEVSMLSWLYRDLYISKTILNYLSNWYNILTSFGRFHLTVQYDIYDKYFE